MDWGQVVVTGIAAVSGLVGVWLGSRFSHKSEVATWNRDQRVTRYASVLGAVDRQSAAFNLIKAYLDLSHFTPEVVKDPQVRAQMDEWGRADSDLDAALPAAELVASESVQEYLSVGLRLGMRTRQRLLLMSLDYPGTAERAEWGEVSTMTHGEVDRLRAMLRHDLDLAANRWRPLRLPKSRVAAAKKPPQS